MSKTKRSWQEAGAKNEIEEINCLNALSKKYTHAIYIAQFDIDTSSIHAFDTTVVGEISLAAGQYKNCKYEDACKKRLKAELSSAKCIDKEHDNYLYNHCVNITCIPVEYSKKAGADKRVHKELRECFGYSAHKSDSGRDTEFFDLGQNGISIVEDAINKAFNLNHVYTVFRPTCQQIDYCKKLTNYINYCNNNPDNNTSNYRRFLLGALCRFGKSAATLYALYEMLNYRTVVCISAKCDTKISWFDDIHKFDFGKDVVVITKEDLKNDKRVFEKHNGKKIFCWLSFQSAGKDMADAELREWRRILKKLHIDCVVVDECHYGVDTERSQKFLRKLGYGFYIDISATPYAKINRGEYTTENSYIYDLIDEAKDFKDGKILAKNYVPIKVYHMSIKNLLANNMLSDGKKTSPKARQLELDKLNSICQNGKFSFNAYFDQFDTFSINLHINMLLSNYIIKYGGINSAIVVKEIKHGETLEKAIDKEKYNVFNVCGDDKYTLAEINKAMENSAHKCANSKPVIMISCGRYLTGVKEKYLDNVVYMCTVNSAENYMQYGSRAKNVYENRTTACNIFDLNTISIVTSDAFKTFVDIRSKYRKTTVDHTIKEFEDCFPIYEFDNVFNVVKYDNFAEDFKNNIYFLDDNSLNISSFINDQLFANLDSSVVHAINDDIDSKQRRDYVNRSIITPSILPPAKSISTSNRTRQNDNANDKIDINKLLNKLIDSINRMPSLLVYLKINSIEQIQSEDYKKIMYYWCNGFTMDMLLEIKAALEKTYSKMTWKELDNRISLAARNIAKNAYT